ncbi:MAG: hypothetical protein FWF57_09220 [Defluviitaleaceae bacterium]|nr:hypothetical protein [Defluviitaleaceae bacterium]
MKKYLFIFSIFLLGCSTHAIETFVYDTEHEYLNIFTRIDNYKLAPLEINGRVHSGVHFLIDNNLINSQIENFEQNVGISHTIYTSEFTLGDTINEIWLFELISKSRIPNIILNPRNTLSPFDRNAINILANHLGSLRIPIFIDIFPQARNFNSIEYVSFFRYAREVFREIAPNVIFIFSINENDILDFWSFYPGHEYVDWVKINHYINADDNLQRWIYRLEAFYHSINMYKPIMVSFGISHFSSKNHTYYTLTTGPKIVEFIDTILNDFKRVRAIIYKDINFIENPNENNSTDNFSISENSIVMDYYIQAMSSDIFLTDINFEIEETESTQFIRSPFKALKIENEIFIPHNFLLQDLNASERYLNQYLLPHRQELRGNIYYTTYVLKNFGIEIKFYNLINGIVISN